MPSTISNALPDIPGIKKNANARRPEAYKYKRFGEITSRSRLFRKNPIAAPNIRKGNKIGFRKTSLKKFAT